MKEIAKISNILNNCLENLNGMKVSGTLNCGRVWSTDQNIRCVLGLLGELDRKLTEETETPEKEKAEDKDADKSDEVQA